MSDPIAFGRRALAAPKRSIAGAAILDPASEAFRAQLAAESSAPSTALADWRRSHRGRLILTWLIGLAVMSPGALCFLFQTPLSVSIGLEALGLAVNAWLRRERRRRLREIVAWEEPGNTTTHAFHQ